MCKENSFSDMDFLEEKLWVVQFNITNQLQSLKIDGKCLALKQGPNFIVYVNLPYIKHPLLTFNGNKCTLRTFAGGKVPVYVSVHSKTIKISNAAQLVMERCQEVRLSTYVVAQHLNGANYPQDNIFENIDQLEASSFYSIDNNGLTFVNTTLTPIDNVHKDDVYDYLHRQYESYFDNGKPISVLLSGGYDSRLNLAFALYYAKKFGNKIYTFHSIKDDMEYAISKEVAHAADVEFFAQPKEHFEKSNLFLPFNEDFINFQSGTYRYNLLQWYGYHKWIDNKLSDNTCIGHGAEPHKGKYYYQINNFRKDCERVFGTDKYLIEGVVDYLGVKNFDTDHQKRFFDNVCQHAQVYDNIYSKIDFIHYHIYIANGYGKRAHNYIQNFSIPFPFLEDELLQIVFSLPYQDKINFKLVIDGIKELAPEFAGIPFTSANSKATQKRNLKLRVKDNLKNLVKKYIKSTRRLYPKGRETLTEQEILKVMSFGEPKSQITLKLRDIILQGTKKKPGIRIEYALELFLYLRSLERNLQITFSLV